MGLEKSMHVPMVTLRVAATGHRHTDGVSGGTYHPLYLPSPANGRKVR